MRCQEAKHWLTIQRDGDLAQEEIQNLREHLKACTDCRAFEQQQRSLEAALHTSALYTRANISTTNIMRAIQYQSRITRQLEDIRQQQQSRIARLRPAGTVFAAISFFLLGCIPLLLLGITLVQTDLVVNVLSTLRGVLDRVFILGEYLQETLSLLTHNSWLLSGVAFAFVIMMGMWLHLMRRPREA
jgi:predicted anti-sigma-YlaC factor YlaD